MGTSLKVIVVDDSLTYRSILKMIVDGMPGAQVVGTAANGKLALARIAVIQARRNEIVAVVGGRAHVIQRALHRGLITRGT